VLSLFFPPALDACQAGAPVKSFHIRSFRFLPIVSLVSMLLLWRADAFFNCIFTTQHPFFWRPSLTSDPHTSLFFDQSPSFPAPVDDSHFPPRTTHQAHPEHRHRRTFFATASWTLWPHDPFLCLVGRQTRFAFWDILRNTQASHTFSSAHMGFPPKTNAAFHHFSGSPPSWFPRFFLSHYTSLLPSEMRFCKLYPITQHSYRFLKVINIFSSE